MRFPRNRQIFRGQLDVAAFAGVLFILLIFVLLHSRLVFTPGVPIQLPEEEELPGVIGRTRTIVMAVDAKGQYYFDNQVTHERLLQQSLKQQVESAREPLILVVQADKDVTRERIGKISVLARSVGFKTVILASKPPATGTNPPPLRVP